MVRFESAILTVVTFESAILAVVTFESAILAVVTFASTILLAVIHPDAKSSPPIVPLTMLVLLTVISLGNAPLPNLAKVTLLSAILSTVTASLAILAVVT